MVGGLSQTHFFKASPFSQKRYFKISGWWLENHWTYFCNIIMFSQGCFKDTFFISDG